MKLYGCLSGKDDQLEKIKSVSLCFESHAEAQKFADFADECAKKMKAWGEDYDHEHFAGGELADIVIARLATEVG